MAREKGRLLRKIAARGVIAALPVAMASAYASGLFIEPPRLTTAKYDMVAEITTTPTTVGVNFSTWAGQTAQQIGQQLDQLQAIGVTNIRVLVPWGLIEPLADDWYRWDVIDTVMSAAAARNMGVLAQINSTPGWASAGGATLPPGPYEPTIAAFADFMKDFADRYKNTVSAYEIWNEPNYRAFFNTLDPVAYTNMLKAVYPILKQIDPTATVVAGAVGATQTMPGLTVNPVDFVQAMLNNGAANFFDALSIHPYVVDTPYSVGCPTCMPGMLSPKQQLEAIMNMLVGKKVWISEFGLSAGPTGAAAQQQSAWIKDLLDYWQKYDPTKVGPVFLYADRDVLFDPDNLSNPENWYGLWTSLGVPKPAADMLKDWIAAHPFPVTPVPPTSTPAASNPIAALFAAFQQMAQSFQQAISSFFNPGSFIQSFVNAISNLFGFLRPAATAAPVAALAATETAGATAAKMAVTVQPDTAGDAATEVAAPAVSDVTAPATEQATPPAEQVAAPVDAPAGTAPAVATPVEAAPAAQPAAESATAVEEVTSSTGSTKAGTATADAGSASDADTTTAAKPESTSMVKSGTSVTSGTADAENTTKSSTGSTSGSSTTGTWSTTKTTTGSSTGSSTTGSSTGSSTTGSSTGSSTTGSSTTGSSTTKSTSASTGSSAGSSSSGSSDSGGSDSSKGGSDA